MNLSMGDRVADDSRTAGDPPGSTSSIHKANSFVDPPVDLPPTSFMDTYVDLCQSLSLPVWIAPLLHAAKHLKRDRARRKKVYRLIQRKLISHMVGVGEEMLDPPTYVYPGKVKLLVRSVFPDDICNYPDPCHEQVVYVTMEDLHGVESTSPCTLATSV